MSGPMTTESLWPLRTSCSLDAGYGVLCFRTIGRENFTLGLLDAGHGVLCFSVSIDVEFKL